MKLNNTRLHCCIFLFIIFNVFVFNNIVAQSTSVCPIGVPMEPKKKTELKAGSMFNEIMFGLAPTWTGLSNMRFADDKKAELTLHGITRSRQILGNNFKFQIPEGATINGIMLMVEGSSQNHKNIDEVEIFLLDRDGEPKGHNKSNQAKLQKAWSKKTDGSDHSWMYGASDDKWGTSWTPADINDPDFGFQIQIRNIDNSVNKVAIDQITILVDYTPAYSFCDDNCLTFYIDPTEKYARYEWLPVPGFRLVSHTYNHQTIDLKANGAKFGLYNVCVNVYDDKNRFVEKCCRNFLYQDCNSSDIQGIVWLDLNDNDLRDPDDKVLTGTSVFLFSKENKPVDTVLTDATGRYTFSMVVPGDYYIKVPELKDKKFVFFKNTDPDFNSDITEKFGKGTTDLFTVEIGRKYEGLDLGYKPLVSIGDFVWEDKNYNGLQDSLESGLSGIKVFLLRQNLSIIDSTVTDQSGKYKFENVNANKYRIRFSFGNNFRPTWVNASNTDKNSKIDTLGLSGLLTFLNSEVRMNIDAGFYRPAAIGDLVWEDRDGNGRLDPDESGLPNVRLTLTGLTGDGRNISMERRTNSTGKYLFAPLAPGKYDVRVHADSIYRFTKPNIGDDSQDSDVVNGKISDITLNSGDSLLNNDAGLIRMAKIGDFVWDDVNANGIQDVGEVGISGVTVTLAIVNGDNVMPSRSTVTNDQGYYVFDTLSPGTYNINIRIPTGTVYNISPKDKGTDDTKDSDFEPGKGINVQLLSGEDNLTADIGLFKFGKLGDFVWEDKNVNGIQDANEPGIMGVTINLSGREFNGDTINLVTSTDAGGKYLFDNLKPGKYHLKLATTNYSPTLPNLGSDDNLDSDAIDGLIADINILGGQADTSRDFGLVKFFEIGDYVWEDQNANGIQDANELPVARVEVMFSGMSFDNKSIVLRDTTDALGKYQFTKLVPGNYKIRVTMPEGYSPTKFNSGNNKNIDSDLAENGAETSLTIAESINDLSIDFGLLKLGSIGDLVWEDLNCDNQKQLLEPGLKGVSVRLSGKDVFNMDVQRTILTDSLGFYNFTSLKPGNYNITFTAPQGYESTDTLVRSVTLVSGDIIESVDMGFYRRVSLGDYVWNDANSNGIQDVNESPLANVTVTLSGVSNASFMPQQSISNTSGLYKFENLKPGTYKLSFGSVADFRFTNQKAGTDTAKDSDVDTSGMANNIMLVSGVSRTDIDAGYVSTATGSIGDFVWEDMNADGLQGDNETGKAGVTVTLSGVSTSGKNISKMALTDANGKYKLDSLPAGKYVVNFAKPQGYFFTSNSATDNAKNSDADTLTGQTKEIILQMGQSIDHIDAGLYRLSSVGDYVWNDVNSNGIQDTSEPQIANVTVTLSGVSNASFIPQQSISNASGLYKFENLKPGTYKLSFGSVADFRFTNQKAGTDTAKDSDVDTSGMANNILLVSGVSRTDIDAGYVSTATGSIGDFVWEDLNGNGLQDSNETGKAGVSIMLSGNSVSGAVINKTVITDANGKYKIDSLSEGTYVVTFKKPEGYLFTQINPTDSNKNSDADPVSGSTTAINLQSGQVIEYIDAGLYKNATIGDFVWDDQNSNGVQDSGEPGLANVVITLTKSGDPSFIPIIVTSDTTGKYRFENVKPGSYNIVFGNVPLKRLADANVGADRSVDSDPDNLGNVSNLSVSSGAIRNDIDAGYVSTSTASIGGYVWEDINANGIQESGEPGIVADSVFLRGESANVIGVTQSTLTDQNGRYIFSNLQAGTYSIRFGRPTGYQPTDENIGTDDKDSDADKNTGLTQALVVETGQTLRNIDAGFWRYGSIGDFVWKDLNKNGIQELGEPGIQGIVLVIKDETGNKILSDTSDVQGNYLFQNLKPGKYTVEATIPSEYKVVPVSSISPALNSDFTQSGAVATTTQIILVSNNQNLNIDLGLQPSTSTLRGLAWKDTNGNGLKDDQELGIDSVIVHLLSSGGDIVSRDTTNSAGEYRFDNIDAGSYRLSFAKNQNMYFTYADQGSNDNFDSDVIDQNGLTSTVTIAAGQEITHVFAGYVDGGSIGDFVWTDTNKDGLQNTDEVGLNGVKIYLLNESGNKLDSAITTMNSASSGYYKFSNLLYGNYKIKFALPQNFEFTSTSSSDTLRNSDISEVSTGMTSIISLLPGQNRTDIDAGLILMAVETGSINGTVWQDNNNNKFRDAIDSLLAGVTVTLHKMDGTIVSTTTSGANGSFTFSQLQLGDYYISVPVLNDKMFVLKQNPPLANGSAISNKYGQGSSDMISVLSGTNVTDIDPGYFRKISIGDFVWEDLNVNGLQDTLEPGLQGVQISLINESGVVEKTVVSDSNGKYLITDVGPGRYKLKFSLLNNFVFTVNTGSDQNKNSKPNPITGESAYVDFINQTQFLNMDAGFAKPGSVGSRVWLDLNGNGIYQSGEPGLSGIKVKLFTEGRVQVDSTTSSTNPAGDFIGFYTFKSVSPGKYYVKFEIPDSLKISVHDIGEDDDNDSDITDNFGPLTTDLFEVMSGQFVKNIDAGAYKPATIGDRVWNDLNKNGVQEQGEPGVANVIVRIFNQSGTLLETTSTNAQGLYSFNNLRQRLYYLQFSLPAGFQFTQQNTSGSSADDSDVDNTGTTPLISLAHGVTLLDIDAGIHSTSSRIVIGTIWKDANEDGLRNLDELYENGVNVHIRELTSGNVKSAVTNHAGRYAFVSDNIGEHVVVVEAPEDHVFSKKGVGNNPDIDSDVDELGVSDNFMLADKYMVQSIDAGYYPKIVSSLSGKVWKDKNGNNLRDDTDSLIQDLVVFLFNKSRVFIKSTKTNSKGEYSFKLLDPGQYYCRIPELPDMDYVLFTGKNTDTDSEITHQYGIGTSRLITLEPGIGFENFDFGYRNLNKLVVTDPKRMAQYEVFPNPVINEIRVKIIQNENQETSYFITNNQGSIVNQGTIQNNAAILEIAHLPSGRYTIHFINKDERILKTFIKIDN